MKASFNYGVATQLLKIIGDYTDDSVIGLASSDQPAYFSDFKKLLKDCVETKSKLK